jgi:hypothetical protein
MTDSLKKELLNYVLENVPLHVFNNATKSFSVNRLYYWLKREMMREYKDVFQGSDLWFSVYMCEVFRPYKVEEIELTDMDRKLNTLKRHYKMYSRFHPRKMELAKEHDELVVKFNSMLGPQNELIKLYKKAQRKKKLIVA